MQYVKNVEKKKERKKLKSGSTIQPETKELQIKTVRVFFSIP